MNSIVRQPAIAPAPGQLIEIRDGVFWAQLRLPFRLNHVNIYLLDEGDGWVVVDTGIGDSPTVAAWEVLLAGPLAGRPVTRVVCTHHHPDHVGMAGWLIARFGATLHMPEAEFLLSQHYSNRPGAIDGKAFFDLYAANGMPPDQIAQVLSDGHDYQRRLTGLPDAFVRLEDGDEFVVNGRTFEVLTGGGHSPDQAMLLCRAEGFFLCADQVLPRISPNVGVVAHEPLGDPLGRFLTSLRDIRRRAPGDVVCYPGHDWPFDTLHERIAQLLAHHEQRCAVLSDACVSEPKSAAELTPKLFPALAGDHQISFGFMETLSHIHYLLGRGELALSEAAPVRRFRRV
ncbi:MAG: MBL fold metallo-hydrolase [Rhizobiales bacterium]|nr:MBL fold metallo-hydrolase [Hyphomicrobiales bacterium]